jgi:hypothetical protein
MNYQAITSDRQFKACTGLERAEFNQLCLDYKSHYLEKNGESYETYIAENCKEPPKFQSLESALFFVLFQTKNGQTKDVLGATFGMCGSSAHKNYVKFLALLDETLEKKSHAQTVVRKRRGTGRVLGG